MSNDRLFKLLKEKYGSLTAVAKELGVGISYLSHVKNGQDKMTDTLKSKLMSMAGVCIDYKQANTIGVPNDMINWNVIL